MQNSGKALSALQLVPRVFAWGLFAMDTEAWEMPAVVVEVVLLLLVLSFVKITRVNLVQQEEAREGRVRGLG